MVIRIGGKQRPGFRIINRFRSEPRKDVLERALPKKVKGYREISVSLRKDKRGFRRYLLRGLSKVSLEVGWLSLAHNLLKKAAMDRYREMATQG